MVARNKKRKDRGKERRLLSVKYKKSMMPSASKLSIGLVISIAVIFLAYIYNKNVRDNGLLVLEETLTGLLNEEKSVSVNPETKVAIGFGSCLDIVVQSNEVVFDQAPETPEHFYSISSREEFLKVFAYFYRHGAAAERYISNSTFFNELVEVAKKAPSARSMIGGNAPLMANRFAKEGYQVLLGAHVSESLQSQFSEKISVLSSSVKGNDIHLLLEYPAGQRWGPFTPPRANRFIVHNDHENPKLSSVDMFIEKVATYKPDLLVISGLHMMDNFPMSADVQMKQLLKVQKLMAKQPDNVRIHFEMASFSDEKLLKNLVENIIPFADSLGMNEQELPNLNYMLEYGNISLLAESRPRIAAILDQMRNVFNYLQNTKEELGRRKLTRLHLHTLAFQAILIDQESQWKNTKAATAKSALTAHRHTCGSDEIDVKKAKLIMDDAFTTSMQNNTRRIPFETKQPISCWEEGKLLFCLSPVLVCTDVLQTGGGGDNISSAGLVLQI